jgi:hypothetical protein
MEHSTAIGTTAGTILSVLTIDTPTIEHTVIIAILGAVVSFITSLGLKFLWNKVIHKVKPEDDDES